MKKRELKLILSIAVRLPYGVQFDEDDCQDALNFIQPTKIYTVNIKEAVDASKRALDESGIILSDFAKGNEKARERMKVQYSIALCTMRLFLELIMQQKPSLDFIQNMGMVEQI